MRASLWLFGMELATFEVEWGDTLPDGTRTVVSPELHDLANREPAPPVETFTVPGPGSSLADTALAEHSDPDTQVSGFGFPMRPKPGTPAPSRDGLLFGFIREGGD